MVSVPATGFARPGFESRPRAFAQSGWSLGRQISLCILHNQINKITNPGWLKVKKKYIYIFWLSVQADLFPRWIEAGGARAVPVIIGRDRSHYEQVNK